MQQIADATLCNASVSACDAVQNNEKSPPRTSRLRRTRDAVARHSFGMLQNEGSGVLQTYKPPPSMQVELSVAEGPTLDDRRAALPSRAPSRQSELPETVHACRLP